MITSDSRYPNFEIESYFKEQSIEFKIHDSDDHTEYAINCPACTRRGEAREDTKFRLWINPKNGFAYCYNCDWRPNIPMMVQELSGTDMTGALKIVRGQLLDPMQHLNLKLYEEHVSWDDDVDEELKELQFPYGYKLIDGPHPYLEKRGIPWEVAFKLDWGYSEVGFCKRRIIVPSYMDDRLVFWQARATWNVQKEDKKVLNPKGVSARSVLYNYDIAKEFEQIVLVEGFVDATKVGENAMATNGKNLHHGQVAWLRKTKAKEIVLMWDLDSWQDAKGKKPCSILRAADMLRMWFNVRIVKMPEGIDAGDLGYKSKEIQLLIDSAT